MEVEHHPQEVLLKHNHQRKDQVMEDLYSPWEVVEDHCSLWEVVV